MKTDLEAVADVPKSRNIAVAYEEVVLAEEDAEILRRMRESRTTPPVRCQGFGGRADGCRC